MAQTAITPDFVQRACALGPIALASSPWARWRAARPGRKPILHPTTGWSY